MKIRTFTIIAALLSFITTSHAAGLDSLLSPNVAAARKIRAAREACGLWTEGKVALTQLALGDKGYALDALSRFDSMDANGLASRYGCQPGECSYTKFVEGWRGLWREWVGPPVGYATFDSPDFQRKVVGLIAHGRTPTETVGAFSVAVGPIEAVELLLARPAGQTPPEHTRFVSALFQGDGKAARKIAEAAEVPLINEIIQFCAPKSGRR